MPFILLLVGLLGGALVSLLVISTTLDAGSYRINNLTQQNAILAKETGALSAEVAQAESPQKLAEEASLLGMRNDTYLRFIDPKTGKILTTPPVAP
jgi:hypothetical protein